MQVVIIKMMHRFAAPAATGRSDLDSSRFRIMILILLIQPLVLSGRYTRILRRRYNQSVLAVISYKFISFECRLARGPYVHLPRSLFAEFKIVSSIQFIHKSSCIMNEALIYSHRKNGYG